MNYRTWCKFSRPIPGRQRHLIIAVIASLLNLLNPVAAKDSGWYRYENRYFVGYSDAREDRTLKLLVDLETFRAAFSQIANIYIPADAPKTQVLILRAKSDFKELTYSKNVAGFANRTNDGMIMVLPASGDLDWGKTVIRHEYGHALLRYKAFNYPQWYDEGFAEMSSTIELTVDGQSFVVGKITDRARNHVRPTYDWDELVSDEFDPHRITNATKRSSAYAQSWMLAHYTTLGDGFRNATKLQNYFDALKTGQSSAEAFKETFGVSASELWATELKEYMRRVPNYTFAFKPDAVDTDFRRAVAQQKHYQPKLDFFRQRAIARKSGQSPRKPLALLNGQWDYLSLESDCDDAFGLPIDETKQQITIEHFQRQNDGPWEPWTFKYEVGRKGVFTLTTVDRSDNDNKYPTVYLQMRSKDLACTGLSITEAGLCARILKRCSL